MPEERELSPYDIPIAAVNFEDLKDIGTIEKTNANKSMVVLKPKAELITSNGESMSIKSPQLWVHPIKRNRQLRGLEYLQEDVDKVEKNNKYREEWEEYIGKITSFKDLGIDLGKYSLNVDHIYNGIRAYAKGYDYVRLALIPDFVNKHHGATRISEAGWVKIAKTESLRKCFVEDRENTLKEGGLRMLTMFERPKLIGVKASDYQKGLTPEQREYSLKMMYAALTGEWDGELIKKSLEWYGKI